MVRMAFAFDDTERDGWSDDAAKAIIAAALLVRNRIAANLDGPLPDNASAVFNPAWWDDAVAGSVDNEFTSIAHDAIGRAADGMGVTVDDADRKQLASLIATTVAALLLHRADVVTERVGAVLEDALENDRDAAWVASTLGVTEEDGDESGPLSRALMTAIGVSVGLAVADMAADGVANHGVGSGQITGTKTWQTMGDSRVRASHRGVSGDTVPVDGVFTVAGVPMRYPHDDLAPVELTAGCRCWCTYDTDPVPADNAEAGTVDDLESVPMPDELSIAASTVTRTFANGDRFRGTKAMARRVTRWEDRPGAVVAAAGAPDHTDGIAVTVEPTPAEKKLLAVPGGTPPAEVHCTLAYLGTTAELSPEQRATVAAIVSGLADETEAFEGEVAGCGWFGSPTDITLYLIDSTGLAAFRTELVRRLTDAGVPVAMDHGLIPHATVGYGEFPDAASRVGMQLHFNNLRVRWGTEVLVADLLGGEVPPPSVPDQPEEPPMSVAAVPVDPTRKGGTPPTEFESITADTAVAPESMPVEPETEVTEPADPGELPDDAIMAEVARRAAQAAVQMVEANGGQLTPDDEAAIMASAEETVAGMFEELVTELAGIGGAETDDGDWETGPEGAPTMLPLGGQEGYATGGVVSRPVKFNTPGDGMREAFVPLRISGSGKAMALNGGLVASAAAPIAPYRGQAFAIEGIRPAPEVTDYDWEGPITVEGIPSGDGRMFAEGSLDWRQLPVPLAFLDRITSEHQEGQLAGWIHSIERREGGAIWGRGTYAHGADGELVPAAATLKAIMDDPTGPRRYGVSVDVDSVSAVYATPDGAILDPMDAQEAYYNGEDVMMMMTSGRIAGATTVLHAAFMEANIWNVGPAADGLAIAAGAGMSDVWRSVSPGSLHPYTPGVVASAGDATVVDVTAPPPAAWFNLDEKLLAEMVASKERGAFDTLAPDDKGRIRCFGIVAPPNECHIGINDRCLLMPRSRDFSRFYATGADGDPWAPFYTGSVFDRFYADGKAVICEGGERVVVGPVILDNVHPNLRLRASDTQPFYAHTGSAVADVTLHMTPHGLVAAGAIRPGVSWIDVYKLRASSVSPDWRPINGENKVMAILAVNVSGFQLAVAASGGVSWEDAIVETQERVEALVASAGVARSRRRLVAELEALRTEHDALVARVAPFLERAELDAARALTASALSRMAVVPTRARTADNLARLGLGAEDCGCN